MRGRIVVGIALATVVVAACSDSYDAWFANPCTTPLTIRTFYVARGTDGQEKSDELIAEAQLAPTGVTKVDGAFQDANGFAWFIEVVGGPTFKVTKQQMPKWFVSLPADVCDGA